MINESSIRISQELLPSLTVQEVLHDKELSYQALLISLISYQRKLTVKEIENHSSCGLKLSQAGINTRMMYLRTKREEIYR